MTDPMTGGETSPLTPYGATPAARASARRVLADIALHAIPDLHQAAQAWKQACAALGLHGPEREPGICCCGCGQPLSMSSIAAGQGIRPSCHARRPHSD